MGRPRSGIIVAVLRSLSQSHYDGMIKNKLAYWTKALFTRGSKFYWLLTIIITYTKKKIWSQGHCEEQQMENNNKTTSHFSIKISFFFNMLQTYHIGSYALHRTTSIISHQSPPFICCRTSVNMPRPAEILIVVFMLKLNNIE